MIRIQRANWSLLDGRALADRRFLVAGSIGPPQDTKGLLGLLLQRPFLYCESLDKELSKTATPYWV